MTAAVPEVLNVLVFRATDHAVERIRAVAPERLHVHDFSAEFRDELADEWQMRSGVRAATSAAVARGAAERDGLVRDAHVMLFGLPFPKRLPQRAPNLLWAHFTFAGVSNLMGSDWWGLEGPVLTSSRGVNNALPIAETTIAGALMFAKQLNAAVLRTEAGDYARHGQPTGMTLVAGKTMGIVGLGGIGSHLARLARGLGMRVVATRRSAARRELDVDGVDELFPADQLADMLSQSDYVAVCAMWTPETEGMMNAEAFAAMKRGAILLNVARGEILDEEALVEALHSGQVGGAYLDVWYDDIAGAPPRPSLQAAPNVVFTPHVSAGSDVPQSFSLDIFISNLERLLRGEPLENAVDWSRGY